LTLPFLSVIVAFFQESASTAKKSKESPYVMPGCKWKQPS